MHTVTAISPAADPLIGEYLEHLADLGRAQSTITHYGEILGRADREISAGLSRAFADELRDWINDGSRRNVTRDHYRAVLLGFFKWATSPTDQRLDFNSAGLLQKIKVPRGNPKPISTNTLQLILASAAEPYRRWFLIAAYAGLRCCELAGLDRKHITHDELIVVAGKGSQERTIPTHPLIWQEVEDLRGPVVVRLDGRRASRRYVSGRGNHYLQIRLGLDGVHMHRLRHWFGTAAYVASGKDILVTQRLLGHAQVGTTQRYVQTATDGMTSAVAALPLAS